jgi:hypothetical protein
MSLDQGARATDIKKVYWQNFDRLRIWCSVGADVENGLWSILGAREGLYKTMCRDWDYAEVRDFEWLNNYWKEVEARTSDVQKHIKKIGEKIKRDLDIEIADLDAEGSKFFKAVYNNTPRIIRRAK